MADRQYYEFVTYHLMNRNQAAAVEHFMAEAAIPAYNRLGIDPVGVFESLFGPRMAAVFVLLPHPSITSVADCRDNLLKDERYLKAGQDFLQTSIDRPSYSRIESSLMAAFTGMPKLELPPNNLSRRSRIFEIRQYDSHSMTAHKRKIEMFNEGNEIRVFRNTGLQPVLFGETLIGNDIPNLTYMLTFDDMTHLQRAWEKFKNDPEWVKLRDDPYYADTVSDIRDIILSPLGCSQM